MNTKTRSLTAGMALLLMVLSLTTAVNLTAPRIVRADPGVRYTALTATGPVARYSFAQFGGTYTPITGGTVHDTGAIDDNNYNAVNIGFTFNYDGVAYTQVSINTNGFLRFGGAAFSGSCDYTPISSTDSDCTNLVSALGMDLQGNTGGELRSQTLGTAPNRIFVVQWKDFRYYDETGDSFNFQIRLYETTDVVEIVYGAFTKNSTSRSPQVGLKGGDASNYNNRTGTNWAASTRGTTNSATMTLSQTSLPASGQTYQWTPSGPGVFYAAPSAQGSGDCSDWANACTLQTALSQAFGGGDEIWVKAGVHYPTTDPNNRDATFTLKNGVAIYGGFAGTESSRDQRNWQTNLTILSGDIDQNDINNDGNSIAETWNDIQGNNSYHVVTGSETDATAVLDGFFITAGQASGMYNYDSSPTLMNVTFSGNSAGYLGGGMVNFYGSPTLMNVTFSGNSAGYSGGGMVNFYGSPTLMNVTFSGNSADYGGGMLNYNSSPTLTNVTFSGNSATYGGGGMYNNLSDPELTNILFYNNSAANGGGIYNSGTRSVLTNITFSGNRATNSGGGIYNGQDEYYGVDSETTIANSIVWDNGSPAIYNSSTSVISVTYSLVEGGWPGEGNIDADPLFVDAANGNLRLQPTSPAIDAGNNAAVPPGVTTDLDGNPRIDYIVDMGAYEYRAGPGPRPFGKALPLNGTTSQPLTLTLSWHASILADTYAYCYDTTNNAACDSTWITTSQTSAQIGGLSQSATYYWQVRAVNNEGTTYADGGSWWAFTTAPSQPGLFRKLTPLNGTVRAPVAPTLSWSDSPGAVQYEYCYDTSNDNACSSWISAGTSTSVTLPTLLPDTTYYWQVRAVNSYGTTYANGSSTNFWFFTTYHFPGAFNKTSPADGSDQQNTVTLSWSASSDVDAYEYCYDTTNDNACSEWLSAETNTSVSLSNLIPGVTYYWQVRARNAAGLTYADGSTAYWSFTVNRVRWQGANASFVTDLARTQWSNFRLIFQYFSGCLGGVNTGVASVDGPGSISNNQFSYWSSSFSFSGQFTSAINATGTYDIRNYGVLVSIPGGICVDYVTQSGTWNATRTVTRPWMFGKSEPANGAVNQNTTLALQWTPSTDATEYQYCLDTSDNNACDATWVSAGVNLSADLSGLAQDTTYYWQVRASNAQGTTDADNGAWWWFRTRDTTPPTVVSITRLDASPTNAANVRFLVTFSEAVQNVDTGDFSLNTTGSLSGASVTGVAGSGAAYTVTVGTGSGSGTLRLDVPNTATISDPAGNPLAGLPYTDGEAYTVDKTAPGVASIVRADASPTNAASVRFRVTFSEAVQNVDIGDFSLNTTGSLSGASVTGVSGSGAVYTVTVGTGSGSGTLRLDIPTTASITDLIGNPLAGLPYTGGETYVVGQQPQYYIFLPLVLRSAP